jgi:hypothetical protein
MFRALRGEFGRRWASTIGASDLFFRLVAVPDAQMLPLIEEALRSRLATATEAQAVLDHILAVRDRGGTP